MVWCWKCGKVAVDKPRGLVQVCPEVPNEWGEKTLRRLRRGQPPYHLKQWPAGDECMFRKLVVNSQATHMGGETQL